MEQRQCVRSLLEIISRTLYYTPQTYNLFLIQTRDSMLNVSPNEAPKASKTESIA